MNHNLKAKYLSGDFLLKGEFQAGQYGRESVLTNAEKYAGYTLPSVFPDDPLLNQDEMQHDYQSIGAQAVNNLANKIMMALFQPSRPFFRLKFTDEQKAALVEAGLNEADITEAAGKTEREGMNRLALMKGRVVLHDAILQLIVTGNSLLHTPKNEDAQVYSLRDYQIKRDLRGRMIKLIIRETKSVSALEDDLALLCKQHGYHENDDVSLYTGVCKISKTRFMVWQELEDLAYSHKQVGYYKEETLEYIPLVWKLARGKDYGTGLVEDYAGDFHSLSTISEAILDYTTIVTDVKNLVNPAGMTDVREITEAPSGAYVHGREEDLYVHTPQVSNNAEFLLNRADKLERRLAAAFLMQTAITRDAERVTAEEIRMQAMELESAYGGVYSRLAQELQYPLAKRILAYIDPEFKSVEPLIVTGLETLSRNSEMDNIRFMFSDLGGLAELPDAIQERIDWGKLVKVVGTNHGVDYGEFLLDEKTVQENRKKRMQEAADMAGMEEQAKAAGQQ